MLREFAYWPKSKFKKGWKGNFAATITEKLKVKIEQDRT